MVKKSADIESGAAGDEPPKKTTWGIMRGLCLLGVTITSCLVIALIGASLMGVVKVPEDENEIQTYETMEGAFYQGLNIDGPWPQSVSTSGGYTVTTDVNQEMTTLFTFRNMATYSKLNYVTKITYAGTTTETDKTAVIYTSFQFEECRNQSSYQLTSRRLYTPSDMSLLGEYSTSSNFCAKFGDKCLSAGNASVGLVAFAFVLSVIAVVLMLCRLCGKDSSTVWLTSTLIQLFIWIICAVAIGNFSNQCVEYYGTGLSDALLPFELELVTLNGTVFNVLITAIVFSVLNMIINGYFKYEAPAMGESGIAPAAPAPASKAPAVSNNKAALSVIP